MTFDPESYRDWERQAYNHVAESYESLMQRVTGVFLPAMVDLLELDNLPEGAALLDVATGPGLIADGLAGKFTGKFRVTGVDFSDNMIAIARQKAKDKNLPGLSFQLMDAEKLEFPDATFDRVTCGFGLMHFPHSDRALAEMRRVLKPGGRAVLSVWAEAQHVILMKLLLDTVAVFAPQLKEPHGPSMFGFGNLHTLEQAMLKAGFTGVKIEPVPQAVAFRDVQHYWDTLVQGTGRLGGVVRGLPEETRAEVFKKAQEAVRPYQKDSRLVLPLQANLAVGIRN